MSHNKNKRNHYYKKDNNSGKSDAKQTENIDETNPVIMAFRQYAAELDHKHDKYEKIVKYSRDITIESKRIIFLLHTVDIRKDNTKILEEAKVRLNELCKSNFFLIAKELQGTDQYQFAKAFSAGMQEFIEAYTFYEYLSCNEMSDWNKLQESLSYKDSINDLTTKPDDANRETEDSKNESELVCFIQPTEFILGLADLSGEIMRQCINSLGASDLETCFKSCQFLQQLYSGFVGINYAGHREFSRKKYTMYQSVIKTENVCYNVKVRGGEAAKWGTTENTNVGGIIEDDEGFYN